MPGGDKDLLPGHHGFACRVEFSAEFKQVVNR